MRKLKSVEGAHKGRYKRGDKSLQQALSCKLPCLVTRRRLLAYNSPTTPRAPRSNKERRLTVNYPFELKGLVPMSPQIMHVPSCVRARDLSPENWLATSPCNQSPRVNSCRELVGQVPVVCTDLKCMVLFSNAAMDEHDTLNYILTAVLLIQSHI